MKTIWIGIIIFVLWALFSNYWYVCKIKNLCGEVSAVITTGPGETYNSPDSSAADTMAGMDEEEINSMINSIEQIVIYFAFDSSFVLNDSELQTLQEEVTELSPGSVLLEGHTCNIGSESYNMKLGKRRAERVKTALINQGLAADKIRTESYGELRPAVPNTSPENRKKNRRVEITITQK